MQKTAIEISRFFEKYSRFVIFPSSKIPQGKSLLFRRQYQRQRSQEDHQGQTMINAIIYLHISFQKVRYFCYPFSISKDQRVLNSFEITVVVIMVLL